MHASSLKVLDQTTKNKTKQKKTKKTKQKNKTKQNQYKTKKQQQQSKTKNHLPLYFMKIKILSSEESSYFSDYRSKSLRP